ncbi:MAG: hypothetical protein GY710_18475 [Desulfobacteraceae bacterium]|nr:hypothetical protein [Desulfobacteraceae bacterium]
MENIHDSLRHPPGQNCQEIGLARPSLHYHLSKMPALAFSTNSDLSQGFTVAQVAQKHGWTEPMVWSLAFEDKNNRERFKELGWGLRTWDIASHIDPFIRRTAILACKLKRKSQPHHL